MRRTFLFLTLAAILLSTPVFAQDADDIKEKIDDHAQKIKELEGEIAAYEKELTSIGGEKRTLESTVREIDVSRKKVVANIQVEERTIDSIESDIAEIDSDISVREEKITTLKETLASLLSHMNRLEDRTLVEAFLHTESLDNIWDEIGSVEQVSTGLRFRVDDLQKERESLASVRSESEEKRADRVAHQNTLVAQRRALDITQNEKKSLLSETNQKESAYQKLLDEKVAAKAEFEASLRELESELTYTLDPTRIPAAGKGVLTWPVANVFVTQKFGKTSDSGRLYASGTHNGVDFRASIGTPVMASLSGTIVATGNTDGGGCYSYGKWVLIRHNNGLSTLYAHLSSILVVEGQSVDTRSIIGHSGFTGYATGPHLHFTLFISDGVQVKNLGDWYRENGRAATACSKKGASIPIAAPNAYLDPLEYL